MNENEHTFRSVNNMLQVIPEDIILIDVTLPLKFHEKANT